MSDDILVDVKALLDTWVSANTNSRTPIVTDIAEFKRVSLGAADHIFIWELLDLPEDNSSGAQAKKIVTTIMIDIRTIFSRAHFVAMRKEVRRILNNAQIDVFGDGKYDISDIIEDQDASHLTVSIWRANLKFRLEQFNVII